ncbi:nitric oxide reductase [Solemya pervernicosa gill symbiont]|uniref:Nitric oxide reductase n=1 Tax=Solemya pervernicosa gill symbiont TaxID=642797 RepID=A0A1T2LAS2_9GAMM|nr:VWA domain-containing protein [Solemya pervernicosa gill symbiont]OOZ42209.1 nitric oxide reductase [Solemya pervernicosa gill symbiont]
MEEHVGALWHRFITRAAYTGYPDAAVTLNEVARTVSVLFRALGGDGALRVEAAEESTSNARRGWLQRIAKGEEKITLAWRDEQALRLPAIIDLFPKRELNRKLYSWLAALAAADDELNNSNWLQHNQQLTLKTLQRYPGMLDYYTELVAAHIQLRPGIDKLPHEEAQVEQLLRRALLEPGSVESLPDELREPHPVPLWLHPNPPLTNSTTQSPRSDAGDESSGDSEKAKGEQKRKAKRTDMPEKNRGLIAMRWEAIFAHSEFIKVDRSTDEEDDLESAEQIADDLDELSISQDKTTSSKRIKFDLDLPSEASDDIKLGDGIKLPEWNYKKRELRDDYCLLQPMVAAEAEPCELPQHLRRSARRVKNRFQLLAPSRVWLRGQPDGSEIDLDAYERFAAQLASGHAQGDARLYRDMRNGGRDLACLLLADLSLSTDSWIDTNLRIVDVIRDTLFLFSEALSSMDDRFALYGFSSRHRDHVRFHTLKEFDERYSAKVRGRLAAIRPGFYTRMGAAIRHASNLLEPQPCKQKLLLLLTDGKPNDLDQYEGRYGIEDTRMAIIEARRKGLRPFCVTIDEQGNDYLPHLFGQGGYVVIRKASELPQRLPQLYLNLTQ